MAGEAGGEIPVFLGLKCPDFLLALHNHAQSDGLNAAGRQTPPDFVPKQRTDFVADQPVQNAACQLCLNLVGVDPPGVFERLLDGVLRYFMKQTPGRFPLICRPVPRPDAGKSLLLRDQGQLRDR